MLRPAMSELIPEGESVYEFVVHVAKSAREIAVRAEEDGEILEEKPVQIAVEDYADRSQR